MFCVGALIETTESIANAKPRWWIVISEPGQNGKAIVVSFTDYRAFTSNPDTWPQGLAITTNERLDKDSTIHVAFARYWSQADLDSRNGKFLDTVSNEVLIRARCNVCDCREVLEPIVRSVYAIFESAWLAECS